ncbi:cytochrome [Mycolicibacterium fortuitum]|uniref:Steroid C26-monooxygenase n=2 Tax=Mycolicibacterium fortuitum TaxID=1766 RepID=K0VXA9_MYCFO|nr:cytochrome P450 [Mycolicibacterium fortuitum]AIY47595.1 putative cytochrome P450 hydroxylase [Mycobacterium sp. VKM Ac-1817D]CRL82239.1 cytochrome P450 [Mycolicibacter nonchromogenicus]AMD55389.1 cytochrome [Mycolicibacterium fortuitum subsp. fortuitum DSM 46621 = ATCC 6841 = JCM 6387]EJZ16084.1 cytochrome P450 [Mycolicibacterium fortuitum subsp. fortuitum DSM 46621 = ATCC 6841 = JCM 6387]OBB22114.1 cytochrome [Mycolicibacterium fortuitum]
MSETATEVDIPEYPMERAAACPFAPPQPMLGHPKGLFRVKIWNGSTPWLITGHEEARTLFADSRISVDDRIAGFPHWNEHMLATVDKRPRSVFTSDAEEHTRFRRMLSKPFTFRRVEGLRTAIQKITDECIDEILAGPQPADLVAKLALPVPTVVISEMLGVPYEDHEFFQEHANAGLARYAAADAMQKGAMSLHQYLINLVEEKQANPSEDAVSDLAERVTAGEISVKEAAQLGTGLLIAGHETTANMIGIGILALLENPDQADFLRAADDPKVIANAVEELMRYLSIIQTGQRRVALEDIEIGGETIRAGDGVIIDLSPANWDAKAYSEPDKLDLSRDASQQLGFGYGRHQCVGQQLARAELQIVFHTLLRRIPTLRLAIPLEEVPFKHDRLAYGVYELPVNW